MLLHSKPEWFLLRNSSFWRSQRRVCIPRTTRLGSSVIPFFAQASYNRYPSAIQPCFLEASKRYRLLLEKLAQISLFEIFLWLDSWSICNLSLRRTVQCLLRSDVTFIGQVLSRFSWHWYYSNLSFQLTALTTSWCFVYQTHNCVWSLYV